MLKIQQVRFFCIIIVGICFIKNLYAADDDERPIDSGHTPPVAGYNSLDDSLVQKKLVNVSDDISWFQYHFSGFLATLCIIADDNLAISSTALHSVALGFQAYPSSATDPYVNHIVLYLQGVGLTLKGVEHALGKISAICIQRALNLEKAYNENQLLKNAKNIALDPLDRQQTQPGMFTQSPIQNDNQNNFKAPSSPTNSSSFIDQEIAILSDLVQVEDDSAYVNNFLYNYSKCVVNFCGVANHSFKVLIPTLHALSFFFQTYASFDVSSDCSNVALFLQLSGLFCTTIQHFVAKVTPIYTKRDAVFTKVYESKQMRKDQVS